MWFLVPACVTQKEDAVKELRRIRKKLRQIDNLDLKMHEGQRLEPAEVIACHTAGGRSLDTWAVLAG